MEYKIVKVRFNEFSSDPDLYYLYDSNNEYVCCITDLHKVNSYILEESEYYNVDLHNELSKVFKFREFKEQL